MDAKRIAEALRKYMNDHGFDPSKSGDIRKVADRAEVNEASIRKVLNNDFFGCKRTTGESIGEMIGLDQETIYGDPEKKQPLVTFDKFEAALELGELLTDTGIAAFKLAGSDVISSAKELIKITGSIVKVLKTFKQLNQAKEEQKLLYRLVRNAVARSVFYAAQDTPGALQLLVADDSREIREQSTKLFDDLKVEIDSDLFSSPRTASLVTLIQKLLRNLFKGLQKVGTKSEAEILQGAAQNLDPKLINDIYPALFELSLYEEFLSGREEYIGLAGKGVFPENFDESRTHFFAWRLYMARVRRQVRMPILQQNFSLSDTYVQPMGYSVIRAVEKSESTIEKEVGEQKIEIVLPSSPSEGDPNAIDDTLVKQGKPRWAYTLFDVHDDLRSWLQTAKARLSLKGVSAGPGAGKSSLAKMLAHEIADAALTNRQALSDYHVVLLPLHTIANPEAAIDKCIDAHLAKHDMFRSSQSEGEESALDYLLGSDGRKLLVIFDGLDELSLRGKRAEKLAQAFVERAGSWVGETNIKGKCHVRALVCGRSVIMNDCMAFSDKSQIIHLADLFFDGLDAPESGVWACEENDEAVKQLHEALLVDRRLVLWKKFQQTLDSGSREDADKLPDRINDVDQLKDVSRQPFLLLLMLIIRQDDTSEFDRDTVNANVIYYRLFVNVINRRYHSSFEPDPGKKKGDSGTHKVAGDFSKVDDALPVFEQIGLTAWQHQERTINLDDVSNLKEQSEHMSSRARHAAKVFTQFQKESEEGAFRLMLGFYFSKASGDEARAFEFTHKSFGEYFAARAIIDTLENMRLLLSPGEDCPTHESLKELEDYRIWRALVQWADSCAAQALDPSVLSFLRREVELKHHDFRRDGKEQESPAFRWKKILEFLVGWVIDKGFPMDRADLSRAYSKGRFDQALPRIGKDLISFPEMQRQARNAQEALLAMLNACCLALVPQKLLKTKELRAMSDSERARFEQTVRIAQAEIPWPKHKVKNNNGELELQIDVFAFSKWLGELNPSRQDHGFVVKTCLSWMNLKGNRLSLASLGQANFSGCNLRGTVLASEFAAGSSFRYASLQDAFLYRADLYRADLRDSNLHNSILNGAHLRWSVLRGAKLTRADFRDANLEGAVLSSANLRGANLNRADLTGANLRDADLAHADFRGAMGINRQMAKDMRALNVDEAIWDDDENDADA